MMEFKENKSTISELRHLLGKKCQRRTLRGWIHVGLIEALELRDDEIFVVASTGVRGTRDQKFPLRQCRVDEAPEVDKVALAKEQKLLAREERAERKEKKKEEAEEKAKKLQDRINLIRRLSQPRNPEE